MAGQLARATGEWEDARLLSDAAETAALVDPATPAGVLCWIYGERATQRAMLGDERGSGHDLERMEEVRLAGPPGTLNVFSPKVDAGSGWVDAYQVRSALRLRQPDRAVDLCERILASTDPRLVWQVAEAPVLLSEAWVMEDELGAAADRLEEAAGLARATENERDVRVVRRAGALATPRSVWALLGPNPRVIADEVWAKLLWAGLNLEPKDVPVRTIGGRWYPMELVRAITMTWLFSGQRSDEINRLRVGCVRWQHQGQPIRADSGEVLVRDAVCLLDVPTHKTGTAFTKPVDPLLGQAIEAWQRVRPEQRRCSTRRRASRSTSSSPIGPGGSPARTSTPRSSRLCAPRPGCRPPTYAATSPATVPGRRSPASSITRRSR